jgi:hypothetical protein
LDEVGKIWRRLRRCLQHFVFSSLTLAPSYWYDLGVILTCFRNIQYDLTMFQLCFGYDFEHVWAWLKALDTFGNISACPFGWILRVIIPRRAEVWTIPRGVQSC